MSSARLALVVARRIALLLAFALALPVAAGPTGMSFLDNTVVMDFNKEDMDLMNSSISEVLDSEEKNAKREWSNPSTGSSGLVEVRGQFVATDGATCKRLRLVNKAKGRRREVGYPVCKYEGRGWLVHPEAVPAETQKKE